MATERARTSRPWLLLLASAVAGSLLLPFAARGADATTRPFAVVDLHADLSYQVNYKERNLAEGSGQYRASELLRAGVIGVVLPLYIPRRVSPSGPRESDLVDSYTRMTTLLPRTLPYVLQGCGAPSDRVATWFAFEGSAPLADDPEAVARWTARNARVFGLVHTYDNVLGSSSGNKEGTDNGLSPSGKDFVRRVFERGAVVDVSHASDRTTSDVLRSARELKGRVVATHSNARTLRAHPRNLTDEQVREIAATGGVVGVNFHTPFLTAAKTATVADVVRHIRHLLSVAGPDHVALGSDYEGDIRAAKGLGDVRGFQVLARALIEDGVSAEDTERVFSKNALRVLCGDGGARSRSGR